MMIAGNRKTEESRIKMKFKNADVLHELAHNWTNVR
jgi:hypothetical protein